MNREVMGLVVKTDGTMELTYVPADWRGITKTIGVNYIDAIRLVDQGPNGVHAYVDDEGTLNGSDVNVLGTSILNALGWEGVLFGNAVFLGDANLGDEDGWGHEGDLPPAFVAWFLEWCRDAGVEMEV